MFNGTIKYKTIERLTDANYIDYYNGKIKVNSNLNSKHNYFQQENITNILFNHLKENKEHIMSKNPFKQNYNNNNDLFVHIRLDDATRYNVGLEYYVKSIISLKYDKLYISTDSVDHKYIKLLSHIFPGMILVRTSPVRTIQFGSTCKHIVLSHGSFSAMIGYLGFFSQVYYPNKTPKWCPLGMMTGKGWTPKEV